MTAQQVVESLKEQGQCYNYIQFLSTSFIAVVFHRTTRMCRNRQQQIHNVNTVHFWDSEEVIQYYTVMTRTIIIIISRSTTGHSVPCTYPRVISQAYIFCSYVHFHIFLPYGHLTLRFHKNTFLHGKSQRFFNHKFLHCSAWFYLTLLHHNTDICECRINSTFPFNILFPEHVPCVFHMNHLLFQTPSKAHFLYPVLFGCTFP